MGSSLALPSCTSDKAMAPVDYLKLDEIIAQPVLKKELFSSPLIVEKIELLEYEGNYICRIVSTDGADGISVSNNMQMIDLYPIFVRRLQPFFL